MGGLYILERKAIIGNIIKIMIAYLVTMNICNQFVQKVSVPVKVSGMQTGDYEYVQPVRL